MTVQEWLVRLLSQPATDPLDWESYCVTMGGPTWKALWREIDEAQAYEDGLEAGLRLLQATEHHRGRLGPRGYESNRVLLYRSVLTMLDKADRWGEYLETWESIWAHTSHCLPVRGDDLIVDGPRLAPFVRRDDGGFGVAPLPYGAPAPKTVAVHFLHSLRRRKTLIERRLEQERAGKLTSARRPVGRNALTAEEIRSRLTQIRESVQRDADGARPSRRDTIPAAERLEYIE
jgi:hypothetical protein